MKLSELLKQATAFDRDKAFERLEPMVCYNRAKEDGKPYRKKVNDQSTSVDLAEWQHAELQPILDAVAELIESAESLESYSDNLQNNNPDAMAHGSGESLLGQFTSQVSTDLHYALARLRQVIEAATKGKSDEPQA